MPIQQNPSPGGKPGSGNQSTEGKTSQPQGIPGSGNQSTGGKTSQPGASQPEGRPEGKPQGKPVKIGVPVKVVSGNKGGPISPISDRIQPIHHGLDTGIKLLLYGRSGTGKTTLWATAPKPILVLLCSGAGELLSVDTEENRGYIDKIILEHSSDIGEAVRYQEETDKYRTIVLDHITGLQDLFMRDILGLSKVPEQLSWGLASQQQYGQVSLQLKESLRAMLNLPINVVVIGQEREFGNDKEAAEFTGIAPTVGVAISPSAAGWINSSVDYICRTFIRNKVEVTYQTIGSGPAAKKVPTTRVTGEMEFCLRTGPDATYITKFRAPYNKRPPSVIVDPTWDKIEAIIRKPVE